MDFKDTPAESVFRKEARQWLQANAEKRTETKMSWLDLFKSETEALQSAKAWQTQKAKDGWAVLHWPQAYGGRGATPIEQVIWSQEEAHYIVPNYFFDIGQGMCGPTMMAYATEEQKTRYLPKLASGEEIWCQLFSEPVAGSDLAGLQTRSVQEGDHWVINGQKVWTSGAHYSDYGILVTRSDPTVPKHQGLTFFFLDMKSAGVEVKPIRQMNGDARFNEVFFNDVCIPDSQRLGAVGDGWRVSLTVLMNERFAVGDLPGVTVDKALALAKTLEMEGEPALENPAIRQQLAEWYCLHSGLKNTRFRTISALSRGEAPGPEASITKLVRAKNIQDMSAFCMDLMDMSGILTDPSKVPHEAAFQESLLSAPGYRIAGGSDEILKNIIAERVLGLPQDPRVDKNIPFQDIPTGTR